MKTLFDATEYINGSSLSELYVDRESEIFGDILPTDKAGVEFKFKFEGRYYKGITGDESRNGDMREVLLVMLFTE